MRASRFVLAAAALSFLGSTQRVQAADEVIQVKDVPKVVVDGIKAKFPDAELRTAKKKEVAGQPFFGVAITSKKVEQNVLLTPKGKIVEIKKPIAAADVPAKVTETVYAQYPNSTLEKTVRVTEYKEERSFTVTVTTSDKQTKKLVIDAEGKVKSAK
jgi:hypothetical protein